MPIFGGDKQVTSITVKINQLSTPHRNDEIDESIELYLSDLLHLIKIQPSSGATEAARAIRKKVKYGDNVEEQLRALNILELLILNSGVKIGPIIARDDKLIDVLKGILTGSGKTGVGMPYDPKVAKKVKELSIGWKDELDGLDGYKYFATLWKNIPGARSRSGHHRRSPSGNVFDSVEDRSASRNSTPVNSPRPASTPTMARSPSPPQIPRSPYNFDTSSDRQREKEKRKEKERRKKKKSSKRRGGTRYADEEYKIPQINYRLEAPKIKNLIAECHTHTTTLQNALITLPKDTSPLDDDRCSKEFEKCRSIRRKVLRYLQFVGAGNADEKSEAVVAMDEEFLGSLIYANEQLVDIFKKFDAACGYTEANPAPMYDDDSVDEDGYESYYTDSTEEEEVDEEPPTSLHDRLNNVTIDSGSSSKKPPPPRPAKPASLSVKPPPPKPALTKFETNDTVESDPFGDGKADHSVYE